MRVTVIGAGVGGLAVALRLLAAGAEVTVLERRRRPGGWLDPALDGPFAWNAGPASLDAEPFRRLFEAVGRRAPDAELEASPRLTLEARRRWTSGLPGAPVAWPPFCRPTAPPASSVPIDGIGLRPAAVVAAMTSAIEDLGGRILCGDGADEILVYGARQRVVRTVGGVEHLGDAVIAGGDPIQTRRRLLRSTPAPLRSRLDRHRPGASCLLLRLGLDRPYPGVGAYTPIAGPEPLWLQARSGVDAAPDGGTALTVVLPVASGHALGEVATTALRDRLVAFLEREAGLDGLERAIVAEHRLGPAGIGEAFDCYDGSAFASRPAGERSGQPVEDRSVAGLLHVGARVGRGGGLAGALASAERAAALLVP